LNEDSDVDFLVIEQEVEDRHAEQLRLTRELRPMGIPVDVLVYSEAHVEEWGGAKGSIVHTALTEGRQVTV
jgi:alkyl sulfatase BDS1-like metallo-beta-lactamase superfamily hydrolase